jgi:hypothetical protein
MSGADKRSYQNHGRARVSAAERAHELAWAAGARLAANSLLAQTFNARSPAHHVTFARSLARRVPLRANRKSRRKSQRRIEISGETGVLLRDDEED